MSDVIEMRPGIQQPADVEPEYAEHGAYTAGGLFPYGRGRRAKNERILGLLADMVEAGELGDRDELGDAIVALIRDRENRIIRTINRVIEDALEHPERFGAAS